MKIMISNHMNKKSVATILGMSPGPVLDFVEYSLVAEALGRLRTWDGSYRVSPVEHCGVQYRLIETRQ